MNNFRYAIRNDFSAFVKKAFLSLNPQEEYKHSWYIDYICQHLEECANGKIKRLDINIPPRSLKSFIVSICFPAWVLGKDPSKKFICCSYSASLSNEMNDKTRSIVKQDWYRYCFPEFSLDESKNTLKTKDTQKEFTTTMGGGRYSTSTRATATGKGADFIICDDILNPDEANSDIKREGAISWVKSTLFSRFNDKKKGVIIGVAQRLHERDFTGQITKNWTKIILPSRFEEEKVFEFGSINKKVASGEYLHPDRFNEEEFNETKEQMGSIFFNAQYQQNPAPDNGNVFKLKWFNRYDSMESNETYISIDTACKPGQENDPSAFTIWQKKDNSWYLKHVVNEKLEYHELKAKAKSLIEAHKPRVTLIEDKSSGQSLIQDLRKELNANIIAINPTSDKKSRAYTCIDQFEAGRIFIPNSAPWLEDYLDQMKKFPNCSHDDMVDSTSQMINWIKTRPVFNPQIRSL